MTCNTPRALGIHSKDVPDGTTHRGVDGKMYVSRGNVWRAITPQKKGKWLTERASPKKKTKKVVNPTKKQK